MLTLIGACLQIYTPTHKVIQMQKEDSAQKVNSLNIYRIIWADEAMLPNEKSTS